MIGPASLPEPGAILVAIDASSGMPAIQHVFRASAATITIAPLMARVEINDFISRLRSWGNRGSVAAQ
jgi:hypothetical protein